MSYNYHQSALLSIHQTLSPTCPIIHPATLSRFFSSTDPLTNLSTYPPSRPFSLLFLRRPTQPPVSLTCTHALHVHLPTLTLLARPHPHPSSHQHVYSHIFPLTQPPVQFIHSPHIRSMHPASTPPFCIFSHLTTVYSCTFGRGWVGRGCLYFIGMNVFW